MFLVGELLLVLESYMDTGTKLGLGYLEVDFVCKSVHFLRQVDLPNLRSP